MNFADSSPYLTVCNNISIRVKARKRRPKLDLIVINLCDLWQHVDVMFLCLKNPCDLSIGTSCLLNDVVTIQR